MRATKPLRGQCQHCQLPLQFPAELVGTMSDCPHCHRQTELMLAAPVVESSLPRRSIVYAVVAVVILLFGLAALMVALKHAQGLVNRHPQPAPAAGTNR